MYQPRPIPLDEITEEVWSQVRGYTPDAIVEAIATQIGRMREARERIEAEGAVVRDVKGSVIAHPAIKIEMEASKAAATLLEKHRARG